MQTLPASCSRPSWVSEGRNVAWCGFLPAQWTLFVWELMQIWKLISATENCHQKLNSIFVLKDQIKAPETTSLGGKEWNVSLSSLYGFAFTRVTRAMYLRDTECTTSILEVKIWGLELDITWSNTMHVTYTYIYIYIFISCRHTGDRWICKICQPETGPILVGLRCKTTFYILLHPFTVSIKFDLLRYGMFLQKKKCHCPKKKRRGAPWGIGHFHLECGTPSHGKRTSLEPLDSFCFQLIGGEFFGSKPPSFYPHFQGDLGTQKAHSSSG